MWILVALVTIATQPDPIVLKGNTRFPTDAQCQSKIEEATQGLQAQINAIGGKVVSMRCLKTEDQDI